MAEEQFKALPKEEIAFLMQAYKEVKARAGSGKEAGEDKTSEGEKAAASGEDDEEAGQDDSNTEASSDEDDAHSQIEGGKNGLFKIGHGGPSKETFGPIKFFGNKEDAEVGLDKALHLMAKGWNLLDKGKDLMKEAMELVKVVNNPAQGRKGRLLF